jgi:acetyl-CoA C-acetyltransferase
MGGLSRVPSPKLGSFAIRAALDEVPAVEDHIDECIMGCVLQAGLGQNPARNAGLQAGLPHTLNAHTTNKVCGSGLQAVMIGAMAIKAEMAEVIIGGGMENMSLAPHLVYMRGGHKFGEATMIDHMQKDGLWCVFQDWAMGDAADHIAQKHGISRDDQDAFALRSHQCATKATNEGWFKEEIVPLTGAQVGNRKQPGLEGGVDTDEGFRAETTIEAMAKLRPAFSADGTVTAGNASQISDGGAAVIVASADKADALGVKPLARIVDFCTSGVEPKDIFDAPAVGIQMIFDRNSLSKDDVDLYEINEAFAAQCLANVRQLGLDEDKVNVGGGGVALGHPIGASGARVLTTLIHHMIRTDAKRGICSLCLGGGNAVGMLIERD